MRTPLSCVPRSSARLFRRGAFLFLLTLLAVMPWGLQCAPSPPKDPELTPLAPSLTQAVGATVGSFSVSASGQPQYSLPVAVPPGRAGLEPHLTVAYGGSRQRSSLGRGFSLQGIAAIGRCGSSMAQDDHRRGVALDAEDHLCLDGRRLVPIPGDTGAGTREYRTIPDSGVRVLGHAPPGAAADAVDFFEVFSESGVIATYGRSTESRQMGAHGLVRAFWLSQERDRSGNAVTYHYQRSTDERDGHTIEIQPSTIDYTDSVDGSGEVVTPGGRQVEFGYTTDPSRGDLFYRGLKVESAQVLYSIQTKVHGEAVRTYLLTTVPTPSQGAFSSAHDLLEHVVECAGDGNDRAACRPPTQFNWSTRPFEGGFTPDDELDGTLARTTYVPTVQEDEHYEWLLADVTGDGLADIVEAKAGPSETVVWSVAPNLGGIFDPPSTWGEMDVPPGFGPGMGHWNLGVLDYDDDGAADILLDYTNPRREGEWKTLHVLLARAKQFALTDTGIPRLQTRGDASVLPYYDPESVSAWMLADLNGDGKADLVQCEDPTTEPASPSYVDNNCLDHPPCLPAASRWSIAYWTPTGFETSPSVELPSMAKLSCWNMAQHVTALDADGNGVTDLLFPDPDTERFQRIEIDVPSNQVEQHPLGETVGVENTDPAVLGKRSPRFWHKTVDHSAALSRAIEERYLFPDLNGDGIADVVFFAEEGLGYVGPVTQYLTGDGAAVDVGVLENAETSGGAQAFDLYPYARVMDYNGDGRDDLLVPESYACDPGPYCVRYVVWRSAKLGETSGRVKLDIAPPHVDELANAYALPLSTYKKRLQMRITDLDGDGTQDLVFPGGGGGPLKTYTNRGKLDLLTEVTTGENPLSAPVPLYAPYETTGRGTGGDLGFQPDLEITYGRLTSPTFDPETSLYGAHVDKSNPCDYPRGCVVSQEPVVAGYRINSGDNQRRSFSLRYRDGRFDRRGLGFLGFGEVVRRDDDTGATSIEAFDNVTYPPDLRAYPYAGIVAKRASYVLAATTDADPTRVDMTFTESTPAIVPTWDNTTYYITSSAQTETVEVGHWSAGGGSGPLVDYVLAPNHAATTVRKAHLTAQDFDAFGHAKHSEQWTDGVDERSVIDATYSDDESAWLMGKREARTMCSTAAGKTQCQTDEADYDPTTGLVTETRRAPELDRAYLKVHLERDAHGNVQHRTEEDKDGHVRESWVTYEDEGVFPSSVTNGLNQASYLVFDPGSGLPLVERDLNGHVRKWRYDGFGLLTEAHAIDGNVTTVSTTRQRRGTGGITDFWQTTITSTTPGHGVDREVLDSGGRVVERARRGPQLLDAPRSWFVQEQRYNAMGQLAHRSVPSLEGKPDATLGTDYRYDGAGRRVEVTAPNGATAQVRFGESTGLTTVEETTTAAPDAAGPPKTTKVLDAAGRMTEVHDAKGGVVKYAYGPFGRLTEVTGADLTTTGIEHDPYGRIVHQRDPDRGESDSQFDGFDELLQTTDALKRTTKYRYDALGRVYERTNADGLTSYTYDNRPNGKGLLGRAEDVTQGVRRDLFFDELSRPASMELSLAGGTIVAKAAQAFDALGRVHTLTYPSQAGMDPFRVVYAYDEDSGDLVAVTDEQGKDYWRLQKVDGQDNAVEEKYGAATSRVRQFDRRTNALLSLRTTQGGKALQDWAYAYDLRGNMLACYDIRQEDPAKTSEFFHYDALDRLTCSAFAACRPGDVSCYAAAGPCDQSVSYDAAGNISSKSDVGGYTYDPLDHPHAVKSISGGAPAAYGYDAVGNQTERPGVSGKIQYNSFDLPTGYETATGTVALTYDDAGHRVRKTTPEQDTLSFGEIYERVTTAAGVEDRYYLRNAEGVFAVAHRSAGGQTAPEVRYVFTDHLGSTDVITDETGSIEHERQSFDAFGAQRNAAWGKPLPPVSGPPQTTAMSYTGHELDAEVGIVNAKGRLFDPKLGRFLQVDPLQTDLLNGQRWNSYSYALNNPLRYTDPSGFDGEEAAPADLPNVSIGPRWDAHGQLDPGHMTEWHCTADGYSACVGMTVPVQPSERGTAQAGNAAEEASTPSAAGAVDAALADPRVSGTAQGWSGLFVGVGLGLTPGGAVADQVLTATRVMHKGTRQAELLKSVGEMLGGFYLTVGGIGGELIGTGLTTTGIGSLLGVPAMAVSAGLITGGFGNMAMGLKGFSEALMSSGSGSGGNAARGGAEPRNAHLIGKTHPKTGVPFDSKGYPDFSKFRHPDVPDVRIELSGSRSTDFARANAAAGLKETPRGFTWHHHQERGLMQLVDQKIHSMTGHTGGFGGP